MLTKRRLLAAKIEGSEGVAETLTATETGVLAIAPKWEPDVKMLPRDVALTTLSKLQDLVGARLARITFRAEVYGRSAVFSSENLPVLDPYLKACGLARTLDVSVPGSEFVSYAPASASIPSITIGLYTDGLLKKIHGARGSVKFLGEVGGPLYAEFSFLGLYNAPTDVALLTPSYVNLTPPQLLNPTLTVGAYTPVIRSFELDVAHKLSPRESVAAATGYAGVAITDRDVRGKFDPEETLVAGHAWYDLWTGGTTAALTVGPFGPAQYNKAKITAGKLVYTKVAEGEREGVAVANTDFQCAMTSGDDEFTLKFQ